MPQLFWKFFRVIWLTLAVSVAIIILIVKLLQAAPFEREMAADRRALVSNLAANVLAKDGEDAAMHFVRISEETLPLGLSIAKLTDVGACAAGNTDDTKLVQRDGACYRIAVPDLTSFSYKDLAPLIPWFTILVSSTLSAGALARYLVRPVVHLRDGLSALAHGRFEVRIGDKMGGRKDEVTALAHDFDSTAARLQELQEAQQRLFHDVSHELRSPLSRLQAVVGVLRQSPAKLSAMLDRIDREVERLDELVGEVLTLARLTARSASPLKTQNLDVIELLNEILGDAAFEAEAKDISITSDVAGVFLAEVEGELIYRALENVLRNAVKHTAEHSHISVSCEPTSDLLKICVTDQGPGVRRDELERIFQPFSRGSDAMPKGGYGLGLAITRQAVERHGGRVYAFLPPNGGLAVTLEIPRKAAKNALSSGRG